MAQLNEGHGAYFVRSYGNFSVLHACVRAARGVSPFCGSPRDNGYELERTQDRGRRSKEKTNQCNIDRTPTPRWTGALRSGEIYGCFYSWCCTWVSTATLRRDILVVCDFSTGNSLTVQLLGTHYSLYRTRNLMNVILRNDTGCRYTRRGTTVVQDRYNSSLETSLDSTRLTAQ